MSKKSKNEQISRAFKNNPFHSLKGVAVNPSPRAKTAPLTRIPDEQADDAGLFARSVRGARPIARDEDEAAQRAPAEAAAIPAPTDRDDENEGGLFLKAMTAIGAATVREKNTDDEDLPGDASHRSASSRLRQLKKGTMRISQELDLHGSLREEALRRLQHFIAGAHARGDQAVLVITGKGINSAEGPVLPGAVDEWLRGPGKKMVAEFAPAPRDKGGSGAFVVFLRSRK
jgi:DNA-nicking Smr family endonuclease